MSRSRRWAAPAAGVALLALGAAGCGGHPDHPGSGAAGAAASGAEPTAPGATLSTRPTAPTSPRPTATTGPGTPPAGAYDDTTGSGARAPRSQLPVLQHLPGATSPACVGVGARAAVRSGAVAMGDFAQARADFTATHGAYDAQPSHFYVIPRDRHARSATVTVTHLHGSAPTIRASADHLEDAAQWQYFPISVKITRPGTWRFTVRVGDTTGCFVATFAS